MRKRKICIVSGSRADYGHIKTLMNEIQDDSQLKLQLVVTGMHLSPDHGLSYKVIESDGFTIDKKLHILKYDNSDVGVVKSLGLGCQLFADAFEDLNPDIIVLLGDRYEMLAAAIAAYISKIPISHIAGGESTEGQIDEGIRHSITKMASFHFVSTEAYKNRVIQLGEHPRHICNYGAPGLDQLYSVEVLDKERLSQKLNFDFSSKVAICTYHPVTLSKETPEKDINILLRAIKKSAVKVIFTKANIDPFGNIINDILEKFCRKNPEQYRLFDNLGPHLYYSCLKNCQLMIGNSSSGLVEAPFFGLPVVNIGERQSNRVRGTNVIDVKCSEENILKGIKKAIAPKFLSVMKNIKNPYDRYCDGNVSYRIKEKLKKLKLDKRVTIKRFYDLV